jgi:hypothetical protein
MTQKESTAYYTRQAYVTIEEDEIWTIPTSRRNTSVSLADELQQIQTLSNGIENLISASIATRVIPSIQSTWEERAQNIRKQLKVLSDEVAQRVTHCT